RPSPELHFVPATPTAGLPASVVLRRSPPAASHVGSSRCALRAAAVRRHGGWRRPEPGSARFRLATLPSGEPAFRRRSDVFASCISSLLEALIQPCDSSGEKMIAAAANTRNLESAALTEICDGCQYAWKQWQNIKAT